LSAKSNYYYSCGVEFSKGRTELYRKWKQNILYRVTSQNKLSTSEKICIYRKHFIIVIDIDA